MRRSETITSECRWSIKFSSGHSTIIKSWCHPLPNDLNRTAGERRQLIPNGEIYIYIKRGKAVSKTFYWLFIVGFGCSIILIFWDEIHEWMVRKDRDLRKRIRELEKDNKEIERAIKEIEERNKES